jgi:hypothetical protein
MSNVGDGVLDDVVEHGPCFFGVDWVAGYAVEDEYGFNCFGSLRLSLHWFGFTFENESGDLPQDVSSIVNLRHAWCQMSG